MTPLEKARQVRATIRAHPLWPAASKARGSNPLWRIDVHTGELIVQLTPRKAPPVPTPTLDAARYTIQPGNYEQTSADHLAYAWTNWHSPRTPLHSLNGDPDARYIADGDHYFIVKGIQMVQGFGGRHLNFHNVAGDPGWNGVSALAWDIHGVPGHSGSRSEWTLEYERVQDADDEPHSGGAHWAMPESTVEFGKWRWYAIEMRAGRNEDGMLKVADWETGAVLLQVSGINTLKSDSTLMQLFEGIYLAEGVTATVIEDQTPALFSAVSFADALTDRPVLVDKWAAQGPTPASVQIGFSRVQVPASPLAAAG